MDLAVLKIDAKDLPVVPWSETERPAGRKLAGLRRAVPGPHCDWRAERQPPQDSCPVGALGVRLADGKAAKIEDVMEGSAAEKAGLQVGDVIAKVNGKEISGARTWSRRSRRSCLARKWSCS